MISVILKKTREETTTDTIKTPNPTSIEFLKIYLDMMEIALKDNNIQLIIVMDNLDRIQAEDALSFITTMLSIFDVENRTDFNEDLFKRFWLIVPLDKEALKSIWNLRLCPYNAVN